MSNLLKIIIYYLTNLICGGKAIKATSDNELDKKPRILPQFTTQLVALPFCLADPFLAAKISIMAMFETWLGNIILTFLR